MHRAAALFLVGCLVFIAACLQAEEGIKADRIVVLKNDHKMLLYANGQVIRTYKVALGRGGIEKRERAGDHRVPEGTYVIDWRNPTYFVSKPSRPGAGQAFGRGSRRRYHDSRPPQRPRLDWAPPPAGGLDTRMRCRDRFRNRRNLETGPGRNAHRNPPVEYTRSSGRRKQVRRGLTSLGSPSRLGTR